MIEQARNFILKEVDNPALNHPDLTEDKKQSTKLKKTLLIK